MSTTRLPSSSTGRRCGRATVVVTSRTAHLKAATTSARSSDPQDDDTEPGRRHLYARRHWLEFARVRRHRQPDW